MPKKYREAAELLQPVGDKLVEARWASAYGQGPAGAAMTLTPAGVKMFKKLWGIHKLMVEAGFNHEDLRGLSVLVSLYGSRAGWR